MSEIGVGRSRKEAVEHVDDGIRSDRSCTNSLADMRHEECLAAGSRQCGNRALDTDAVGIRLDHGGGLRTACCVAQGTPVTRQRVEIDMENSTRFGVGGWRLRCVMCLSRHAVNRMAAAVISPPPCGEEPEVGVRRPGEPVSVAS